MLRHWLILFLIALCLGCSGSAGPAPVRRSPEEPPPDLSTRPFGVAQQFLAFLAERKYAQAQALLSQGLRAQITTADLESRMRGFRGLEKLIVSRERVQDKRGVVEVRAAQADPSSPPVWRMQFVQELAGWRIDSVDGAPFPRPYGR